MANIITLSRIFLAFVAMAMLFYKREYYEASLVLTVFVMWFDGLDGYVARKFNESSKLGAVLDIMGDRIVENLYWLTFCVLGFEFCPSDKANNFRNKNWEIATMFFTWLRSHRPAQYDTGTIIHNNYIKTVVKNQATHWKKLQGQDERFLRNGIFVVHFQIMV